MTLICQGTARTFLVGPILDDDGVAVTTEVVASILASKNGGAPAALHASATLVHQHTGHYLLAMTTADVDTLGVLELSINNGVNAMPVRAVNVVPANVFDSLVLGSDYLDSSVVQWLGTAPATPTVAGVPKMDLDYILGHLLTQTGTQVADGFEHFFDVATPTGTVDSLPAAAPDAAGGLPISDAGGLDMDDLPTTAEFQARTLAATPLANLTAHYDGTRRVLYVSTAANGGDNANDGSGWGKAKLTIAGAVAAASSGDTIRAGPGDFDEDVDLSALSGITFYGSGKRGTSIGQLTLGTKCSAINLCTEGIVAADKDHLLVQDCISIRESATPGESIAGDFIRCEDIRLIDSCFYGSETGLHLHSSSADTKYTGHVVRCLCHTRNWTICAATALKVENYCIEVEDSLLIATGGGDFAYGLFSYHSGRIIIRNSVIVSNPGNDDVEAYACDGYFGGVIVSMNCELSSTASGTGNAYDLFNDYGTLIVSGTHYDPTKTSGTITDLDERAVQNILVDNNLDHLLKTAVADNADMTTEVTDGTVLSNVMTKGGDTSDFVPGDDSLEGLAEGVDGVPTTTEFEARTILAASYFDPSVDEVTTDTASRTASKADVSGLSTHDAAAVKTAIEADGSKVDHLWETTEDDAGVRRFTENALEEAPGGAGVPPAEVDVTKISGSSTAADVLAAKNYSAYSDGIVVVADSTTDTGRAANLRTAYTAAKALTPGGNALATNNRGKVLIPDGRYDFGTGDGSNHGLEVDGEFVDLFGLSGNRDHVVLTSQIATASRGTVEQTADDVEINGITIEMDQSSYVLHIEPYVFADPTDPAAYFPDGNLPNTKLTNVHCITRDTAHGWAMRQNVEFAGYYTDVKCTGHYGFAFCKPMSGVCKRCEHVGDYGFCGGYLENDISGVVMDCVHRGTGGYGAGGAISGLVIGCRNIGGWGFGSGSNISGACIDNVNTGVDGFGARPLDPFWDTCQITGTLIRNRNCGGGSRIRYCAAGAWIDDCSFHMTSTDKDCLVLEGDGVTVTNSTLLVVEGGTGIPINDDGNARTVCASSNRFNNEDASATGLGPLVTNKGVDPNYLVLENQGPAYFAF